MLTLLLVILLATYSIMVEFRNGNFLSLVNAFHIIVLIFIGLAGLVYVVTGENENFDIGERVEKKYLIEEINSFLIYFILGYAIFIFFKTKRKSTEKQDIRIFEIPKTELNIYNSIFLIVIIISKISLNYIDGNMGVGTIFPVVIRFTFPLVILCVFAVTIRSFHSVLNLLLMLLLLVGDFIFSTWRSELIFFIFSITLAILYKFNMNLMRSVVLVILSVILILIVLPFQQLKKNSDYRITEVDNLSFVEGVNLAAPFLVSRLNYCREMAYVGYAVDHGTLDISFGGTYKNLLVQIVPRAIWPSKPLFNNQYGREIGQTIGLIGYNDEYTSWAVNPFAEFMYNFNRKYLVFFVFILFYFFYLIDIWVRRISLSGALRAYLVLTLFFICLNLVSVVFTSTYIIWSIIFVVFLEYVSTLFLSK